MTETREARIKEAIERLKGDLDFFDSLADEEGFRDGRSDDLRTLIEAVEAIEPRPIEEAPMDGTDVLLRMESGIYWQGFYRSVRPAGMSREMWAQYGPGWTRAGEFDFALAPTHFIPLSALPQPEVKNDE